MRLILVARYAGCSRRIALDAQQLALAALTVMLLGVTMAFATQQAAREPAPPTVPSVPREAAGPDTAAALAALTARLQELDRRTERLLALAGYEPDDWLDLDQRPVPRAARDDAPATTLERLRERLDQRRVAYAALETLFTLDDVRRRLLPQLMPLDPAWIGSDFGWRPDPFTGDAAFHDGLDLLAEPGSPIRAAGGGVVVYSDFHPQYGNMLALDHGHGLVTRYAHAERRQVEVGDVVARGETIGVVGSSGRSTGVHLHFEVRRRGVPLDPAQFLRLRG